MDKFLVQRNINGEIFPKIMSGAELIEYINMSDCYNDETYEIFDCTSTFGEVRRLYYTGWQPNCLIEIIDENKEVVLRGYGTDH